ncbi:MAG: MarC family protein [Pseudomonadota bacterium]
MYADLIKYFFVLFVVVEPVSLVPMFAALTVDESDKQRRRVALKATILSAVILVAFTLGGQWLLHNLGISVAAFKIGGGVLLLLLSIDMVFARRSGMRSTTVREQDEARDREDISVFPLAFPLIAGPGALATLVLIAGEVEGDHALLIGLIAIVLVLMVIVLALLMLSGLVMRVLGVTGANMVSRIFGVILVALAIQYLVDGIKTAFGLS